MNRLKNYIFIILATVFCVSAVVLATIWFSMKREINVKLNESDINMRISCIGFNNKKYIAVEELDGILDINFKIANNKLSVLSNGIFQINKQMAQTIGDNVIESEFGKEYIEESSVEVTELVDGNYLVARRTIWPEGTFGHGGGYEVVISRDGRVITQHIID